MIARRYQRRVRFHRVREHIQIKEKCRALSGVLVCRNYCDAAFRLAGQAVAGRLSLSSRDAAQSLSIQASLRSAAEPEPLIINH
jgi:hypothetical protein